MATAKTVTKLGDKLIKVTDSLTVNMYDNGYMVEVSGRNKKGDYITAKLLSSSIDEMLVLVREACEMERES